MKLNGKFVISLDFELFWGVRDKRTIDSYGEFIEKTHEIVPELVTIFNDYKIKSTFATVGFLFAESKKEIEDYSPNKKPYYVDSNLSPYSDCFVQVEKFSEKDLYHYAPKLISLLVNDGNHEIASHTFSHFYCLEEGQTKEDFEEDVKAAVQIAKNKGVDIKSMVFPRNQVNFDYMENCANYGIIAFRGNERVWFNKAESEEKTTVLKRIARTLDCYINISGHHCYSIDDMGKGYPYNIPSSRFLRPYLKKLSFFEPLKLRRIKKGMTYAAKRNELYHLWWHPHNFGNHSEENFNTLHKILEHYKYLNIKYGFESITMEQMANLLNSNNKNQIVN